MKETPAAFPENVNEALADETLQAVVSGFGAGIGLGRAMAAARLPEFDALRDEAVRIKDHVLDNLDFYLERFEEKVIESGGEVHWCATIEEANETILKLCRSVDAKTVTKGKSIIAEELGLNAFLETNGITPVETDLGEYIVQLAGERPSHIIAPAIHKSLDQVSDLFAEHHDAARLTEGEDMVREAREVLRDRYFTAEVGITGANFLIAETGSTVIVTNEGNGDLTQTLPKMHIVTASLEKVVPTLDDMATLLRVLTRSATGQEISVYTTLSTGPRRTRDPDGPESFHVILLDNGRSRMLGTKFRDMLRCIRCGACMNACPVYGSIGGHAYGSVYVGPMGAVLTPFLESLSEAHHLPNASTFCNACAEVCPVRIPIPDLLRHWREEEHAEKITPGRERLALGIWAWFAKRPRLYRFAARFGLRFFGREDGGVLEKAPFLGGWTGTRDFPAPGKRTFIDQWRRQ